MKMPTLLLVEDNKDDAELILSVLSEASFRAEVIHVKDGAEALNYLFARSEKFMQRELPQLTILDLRLPKVPGFEVLKQMRAHTETARLPVVIFTSSDEESDLIESYHLGVSSYVQKPVDADAFNETVGRLIEYWFEMNLYPMTWERSLPS